MSNVGKWSMTYPFGFVEHIVAPATPNPVLHTKPQAKLQVVEVPGKPNTRLKSTYLEISGVSPVSCLWGLQWVWPHIKWNSLSNLGLPIILAVLLVLMVVQRWVQFPLTTLGAHHDLMGLVQSSKDIEQSPTCIHEVFLQTDWFLQGSQFEYHEIPKVVTTCQNHYIMLVSNVLLFTMVTSIRKASHCSH